MSSATAATTKSLVIVITGASRGLGAGMAKTFLEKGHKLGLCSRSTDVTSAVWYDANNNNNGNIYYESVDVCNSNALQDFLQTVVAKFGRPIDLWINNAGILGPIQPIRDTNYDEYNKNIQINLGGVFHGTKAFINHVRSTTSSSERKDATLGKIIMCVCV